MTQDNTREALAELVGKALTQAFHYGQTYWQQADSESYSQNAKSNITRGKFDELRAETLAALSSQPPAPSWQPIETAPKSGEFLLGVWEGDWSKPRTRFRIYHATGYPHGPSWAMKGSYRTEEGGAYEVAGWTPLPSVPSTEGAAG